MGEGVEKGNGRKEEGREEVRGRKGLIRESKKENGERWKE